MKKYLSTFALLAFTGALLSLQASTVQSYAVNSSSVQFDHFRQDTVPRSDTSKKHKKWKKPKGDSSWPKKDTMPQ